MTSNNFGMLLYTEGRLMKIYMYKKINAIEHGWFADGSFSLFFLFFSLLHFKYFNRLQYGGLEIYKCLMSCK